MSKAEQANSELLLQVYLAEYQALTTRTTNYIVMSTVIWPLIVSFIGFLATAWYHLTQVQSEKFGFLIVFWGGTLAVQLALMLWTFLVCEQYKTTFYIEKRLWPLVRDLVNTPNFWLYEQEHRAQTPLKKWFELQTELWVFIIILAVTFLRIQTFHYFGFYDWIGLAVNIVIFGVLLFWAVSAARIRQKWQAC
ncbi:MAG: hypothetical protein ACYC46_14580 [Acidobacteriaceae bacterium]